MANTIGSKWDGILDRLEALERAQERTEAMMRVMRRMLEEDAQSQRTPGAR